MINYDMSESVKVFFDLEFTGLNQNADILSIGLISDDGKTYYAEISDYDPHKVSGWVHENVINHFNNSHVITKSELKEELVEWFSQFTSVEMWSDVGQYDWVIFCNIFGSALDIPKNINYICFDLATLLKSCNIDPDIYREKFVDTIPIEGRKHNAIWDAQITKACYEKLMCKKGTKDHFCACKGQS